MEQDKNMIVLRNGHKLPVTCLCIDSEAKYLYSGSKDGAIVKWCLRSNKLVVKVPGIGKTNPVVTPEEEPEDRPSKRAKRMEEEEEDQPDFRHNRYVHCLAISHDDKYLVSGGYDRIIRVWDPTEMEMIHAFTGHRDEITGLVFRDGYHQLYSSSLDRTVKLWTLEDDQKAYVESLFGHESGITSIDALSKERAITSGGRDASIRIWKIVEQAQTVFESSHGSVDIVKFIDLKHFVTGGEDGSVAVWSVLKKKPLFKQLDVHHQTPTASSDDCKWISALATYTKGIGGDCLLATGSNDSIVRVWKLPHGYRNMKLVKSINICGFINCLKFTKDGKRLAIGVGQEHRFGRWWRNKLAKNCIYIVPTDDIELQAGTKPSKNTSQDNDDEDMSEDEEGDDDDEASYSSD